MKFSQVTIQGFSITSGSGVEGVGWVVIGAVVVVTGGGVVTVVVTVTVVVVVTAVVVSAGRDTVG